MSNKAYRQSPWSLVMVFLLLISAASLQAQAPQLINYQAVVRNASNAPIVNAAVSFRLSIHESSPTGNVTYSETHLANTNSLGLVSLHIGNGSQPIGQFSNINWAGFEHFLEIEADVNGGTSYVLFGTSELVSVPYALHAKTVEIDQTEDADADSTNEIQSISISQDTIFLSSGGFVELPQDQVNDNDADSTNELQLLGISGDSITISQGNTIQIPNDNDWERAGNHVYNASDSIGIGTNTPSTNLDIVGKMQYQDGNEGSNRILMSDSLGNARWDTFVQPDTFRFTNPNWRIDVTGNTEHVYCGGLITLTKRSVVMVTAAGHGTSASPGDLVFGIVFSGESLVTTSPRVFWDLKEGGHFTVPIAEKYNSMSTTRIKILPPGTYTIEFRFISYNFPSNLLKVAGASLKGVIIPME